MSSRSLKTYLEREHSILLSVTRTLYVYQVCHGVGRCVKDGSCSSSSLEWKLMDSINGLPYYLNKCQTLSITSQMTLFFKEKKRIGAHTLCLQHIPTATHSTSFLLNHARTVLSWKHWLYGLGSHTAAWVVRQKTEEIKQRLVEFCQCTDTAFKWKNAIFVFPCSAR